MSHSVGAAQAGRRKLNMPALQHLWPPGHSDTSSPGPHPSSLYPVDRILRPPLLGEAQFETHRLCRDLAVAVVPSLRFVAMRIISHEGDARLEHSIERGIKCPLQTLRI